MDFEGKLMRDFRCMPAATELIVKTFDEYLIEDSSMRGCWTRSTIRGSGERARGCEGQPRGTVTMFGSSHKTAS